MKNTRGSIIILVTVFVAALLLGGVGYGYLTDWNWGGLIRRETVAPDPYEGWLTYTNEKHGFSFKYPPHTRLSDTWNSELPIEDLPDSDSVKIIIDNTDSASVLLVDGLLLTVTVHSNNTGLPLVDWYLKYNSELYGTKVDDLSVFTFKDYYAVINNTQNLFLGVPSQIILVERNETQIVVFSASFSYENELHYRQLFQQILDSFTFID